MSPQRRLRVGIFVDSIGAFGRGVTRGILAYQRYRRWEISLMRTWMFAPTTFLDSWSGDGLIAMIANEEIQAAIDRVRRPVVCVSSLLPEPDPVSVLSDDEAVGEMAAKHFIDRGFRNFAFCAHADTKELPAFITGRQRGFRRVIEAAGHTLQSATSLADIPDLLRSLTPPCALLAANDEIGIRTIEMAEELDLRVPEQISVIGVDDDDLLVDSIDVSLSSVALPTFRIGFEAAALLDKIMTGDTPPQTLFKLPPLSVTARKSSDLFAIPDQDVTAALAFIRQHAGEPISVASVVADIPVSRRVLERRFQQYLQRTIRDEIERVRIERARSLLTDTDLSVGEVMEACGFASRSRFHTAFARSTSVTPREFRRQYRDQHDAQPA